MLSTQPAESNNMQHTLCCNLACLLRVRRYKKRLCSVAETVVSDTEKCVLDAETVASDAEVAASNAKKVFSASETAASYVKTFVFGRGSSCFGMRSSSLLVWMSEWVRRTNGYENDGNWNAKPQVFSPLFPILFLVKFRSTSPEYLMHTLHVAGTESSDRGK